MPPHLCRRLWIPGIPGCHSVIETNCCAAPSKAESNGGVSVATDSLILLRRTLSFSRIDPSKRTDGDTISNQSDLQRLNSFYRHAVEQRGSVFGMFK